MKIQAPPVQTEPALRWSKAAQIDGKMPVWDNTPAPRIQTEQNLARAQKGREASFETAMRAAEARNDTHALAYADNSHSKQTAAEQPFGFGDVVDMINPLQHVPVVNMAYREITGDQIRPVGRIIGGALFGGPLGAASGLVNVIAQDATGRDVGENILAMLQDKAGPVSFAEATRNQPRAFRISAAESLVQTG
ncbi:MAG: hypothetical protein L6Q57_02080 [Alphaproteobacteria bacterium]|nr:hypothetical protein [Alphaproteobacteria bacterium]